ncbi:MAG: ATPase P, partial [Syntrophaceticus schinkii]|nr:ATPase P [Syntrophaceticus schinkii]
MIEVDIPGMGTLHLKHLVLDYNGTIAFDGNLNSGIEEKINQLADDLNIYIITADTFGTVNQKCQNIK